MVKMQKCSFCKVFFRVKYIYLRPNIYIMSKDTTWLVALFFLLAVFCQCSTADRPEMDGYGPEYPMTHATGLAIDSCMGLMRSDPALAHRMLDSICQDRLISPQRCDYYHALILFGGEQDGDSALVICDRLLDEGKYHGDIYIEEEICVLASNITSNHSRHYETLKYANRGIALCHGNERMRNDEAALLARVGMAEQMLGRTEKAREIYAKAYLLLQEDHTFGGLIALISLMKKQARLAFDARDYDQLIRISHEILDLVHRFDRDPSFIEERPETMRESSQATRDFADFYETQLYGNIATAYREKVVQGLSANPKADTDSVNHYIDLWSQTGGSSQPSSLANVLRELYFTGRKAAFAEAKGVVGDFYQRDSLVSEYVDYLSLLAEEASSRHDYPQSTAYLQRALVVSDSIRKHELLNSLTEQMSINMVQEERLLRQDAENQISSQRLVIVLLSVLLVILIAAGLIIAFLVRKDNANRQMLEMTQQDLSESQEEIKELSLQLEETKSEKVLSNMEALYERLVQVMKEKQLYLNPDLDIRMLSEELCSSRTLISVSVNSITGKSFRQWLAEFRLAMFVQKLKDFPLASIEDLLSMCGYRDQSTFRRQFKATYGMTPGEYRKKLEQQ